MIMLFQKSHYTALYGNIMLDFLYTVLNQDNICHISYPM